MWRYPAASAVTTASAVSASGILYTPNPTWGMVLPSLRVSCGMLAMGSFCRHRRVEVGYERRTTDGTQRQDDRVPRGPGGHRAGGTGGTVEGGERGGRNAAAHLQGGG